MDITSILLLADKINASFSATVRSQTKGKYFSHTQRRRKKSGLSKISECESLDHIFQNTSF